MSGVNKVFLIGNLGKDPEFRHMEGGIMVAKFPLATTEYFKNKEGQRQDQTEWHNIVLWRGLAEAAEKLKLRKGHMIFIEGKLRTRSWEKDGVKKYATEIIAENMTMLSKRENEQNNNHDVHNGMEEPPISDQGSQEPF
jgi:single-strand DNA-binding protein